MRNPLPYCVCCFVLCLTFVCAYGQTRESLEKQRAQTQKEIEEFMQGKCKLAFDYGNWFGHGGDDNCQFVRMNLATSLENVKEACDRMIKNLK